MLTSHCSLEGRLCMAAATGKAADSACHTTSYRAGTSADSVAGDASAVADEGTTYKYYHD